MFWRTKDGRRIPVSEMERSHLVNALHFVRRKRRHWEREFDAASSYAGADIAEMVAEQSANHAFNRVLLCDVWEEILSEEIHRRKAASPNYQQVQ